VRVNPGTVLVQAHPEESNNKIAKNAPNSFYVLGDNATRQNVCSNQVCGVVSGESTVRPAAVACSMSSAS
jgi:hypothetical protein